MKPAWYARTSALGLVLGLAGLAGGCGHGTGRPAENAKSNEAIRKGHADRHKQLKADIKKVQADAQKVQGAGRKGAHRGP
jgi:hypothetical protein